MSLRIAINAQLLPNSGAGGIQTVLIGLVRALGELEGPETYTLITPWAEPDWLKPYMGRNQGIARGPRPGNEKRSFETLRRLVRVGRRVSRRIVGTEPRASRLEQSNGFYEGLGCDVVHFPYQHFVASNLPSIFNPHDLQHVHYPQFFSAEEVESREVGYGAACEAAHTVVVPSNWVKKDVERHYRIAPAKVAVILTPPPVQAYAEPTPSVLSAVRATYGLDREFAFFPGVTWEHKNHLRLIDALDLLRQRGVRIDLICTGHQTEYFSRIQKKVSDLRLESQVRFLGMIPAEHMRAMYRLAQFTVFPTLFEGAGLPLVEAWKEQCAVTCSAVTSLLEFAGEGALLFDPQSVDGIADALRKMKEDPKLRESLIRRGSDQLRNFNWETTAKAYRAVYRRAVGQSLNEEDSWLLGSSQNHLTTGLTGTGVNATQ